MITTGPALTHQERAKIIAALMGDFYENQLIIGDIHSPMDKLSDIFKIVKDGIIIGGWTIFRGFDIPSVIFPPLIPDAWPAIISFVNGLKIPVIQLVFPLEMTSDNPKPWEVWPEYKWKYLYEDKAMKLHSEEVDIGDYSDLPKIRAVTKDDVPQLENYYNNVDGFQGFFHPLQLESDIYVLAESKEGEIAGVGGTHFETPATVQMGNVHVSPKYRGIGLGRAIMISLILGIVRTHRIPTLFVNEHNLIARKLYESLGFEYYDSYQFYQGNLIS